MQAFSSTFGFRYRQEPLPVGKSSEMNQGVNVLWNKLGVSRLPYNEYFGGVSMFSHDQFLKINGFSNDYWGYGGEDDDSYLR